jgi:Fe-S cluster biogenesis protein NfuA
VFEVPGTTRVYLGADFVSVTKDETIMGWKALKLSITKRLHLFFDQTVPTVTGELRPPEENIEFDCSLEASDFLKELIDTRIRPAVQVCVSKSTSTVHALVAPRLPLVARCVQTALTLFHYLYMSLYLSTTYRPHGMQADGGDVLFLNFDEQTGTVWVKLVGSCVNCPSSEDTLQGNVRNVLSHYAPEVTEVIQVMDEETAITVGKDGREIDRGETPEDKNARFLEHLEAVSGALSSVESMRCAGEHEAEQTLCGSSVHTRRMLHVGDPARSAQPFGGDVLLTYPFAPTRIMTRHSHTQMKQLGEQSSKEVDDAATHRVIKPSPNRVL